MKAKVEFEPDTEDAAIELEVVRSLLGQDESQDNPASDQQPETEEDPENEIQPKEKPNTAEKANWKEDLSSILLLFLLYILQGIPLGIMATIPFLLQQRKVPYKEQAQFSIGWWPFGLKILYAPIIDAFYIKRFGRRKSWLIPLQYLIAGFLFVLSFYIEGLLDSVQVTAITVVFFILNFLAATQDVTVDGWALTMLKPKNVGYAATCNAVGQTLGTVIGYSGFLALNSPSFANNFRTLPQESGLVSFPQFLFFWAVVFAVTTTGILFLKREEKECAAISEQHMDILASYKNLWKILKLKNMRYLLAFFLTVKIGTAATDSMARLKMVEKGVPKEWIAFYSIPLIPVKLLLPFLISKCTAGSNSMGVYINALPVNIFFGLLFPLVVLWTSSFQGDFPGWFYTFLFFVFAIQLIPGYTMFVSSMAFAAKVSDPAIGGTYMTLINTINNVGGMWTGAVALLLVDYLNIYFKSSCSGIVHDLFTNQVKGNVSDTIVSNETTTLTFDVVTEDVNRGEIESCVVKIDGYYVESIICVLIGFVWLTVWGRRTILRLQKRPIDTWRVFK